MVSSLHCEVTEGGSRFPSPQEENVVRLEHNYQPACALAHAVIFIYQSFVYEYS